MWGRLKGLFFEPEPRNLAEALATRCKCNPESIKDAIYGHRGARSLLEPQYVTQLMDRVEYHQKTVDAGKERYVGEVKEAKAEELYTEVMGAYCTSQLKR